MRMTLIRMAQIRMTLIRMTQIRRTLIRMTQIRRTLIRMTQTWMTKMRMTQIRMIQKEDIAKDALNQKEIIDAISKQCIDIEMNHIKEYVKRKKK